MRKFILLLCIIPIFMMAFISTSTAALTSQMKSEAIIKYGNNLRFNAYTIDQANVDSFVYSIYANDSDWLAFYTNESTIPTWQYSSGMGTESKTIVVNGQFRSFEFVVTNNATINPHRDMLTSITVIFSIHQSSSALPGYLPWFIIISIMASLGIITLRKRRQFT